MTETSWFTRLKHKFCDKPTTTEDLITILRQASEREFLETNTLSMLEGVLAVQETRVKDVMVPRTQMVSIEKDAPLEELVPLVLKSGHSRYPVIGEHKDEVLGILLAKDLLNYGFNANKNFNINEILRPAVYIPESKRLNVLLQEFRVNRNHMAIVVDEYGRITGLITIEDVLEQIVGEIEDEHDTDSTPSINPQAEGVYTIKALTTIEEFNNYFNTALDVEDVETIGGLVMRTMGRMPKRGESLRIGDFQFTVLRADNRRIYLLSVSTKVHPANPT